MDGESTERKRKIGGCRGSCVGEEREREREKGKRNRGDRRSPWKRERSLSNFLHEPGPSACLSR